MDEEKKETTDLNKQIENELDLGLPEEKEDTSSDTTPFSDLESTPEPPENDTPEPVIAPIPKKENKLKRFLRTKKGKATIIILAILLVLGILYAVPVTRYGILGLVIKKEAKLSIVDSSTKKPITQADVQLGSLSAKTDNKGLIDLQDVPVGEYPMTITKKNYKNIQGTYTVPIFTAAEAATVSMEATGRQVTVTVTNVITKKPVKDATVTVDESSSVTDEKGEAAMVLPADKQTLKATVKSEGYNEASVDVAVTDQTDVNKAALTPSGTVYYLSKATGKINVMKANLDGSSSSVIVEATGNEVDTTTSLLAARDWQYMVLSAKRKTNVAGQLYVIDAKSNSLKAVEESKTDITLVGWSGHNFLYITSLIDRQPWEGKKEALKSYNADTGKVITVDETAGSGTGSTTFEAENFGRPYILDNKIVYAKNVTRMTGFGTPKTLKPAIMSANPGEGSPQRLKEFDLETKPFIDTKLYEPQEVFFRVASGDKPEYFEYENGSVKSITNDDTKFYNTFYPTYLVSPDGQKTLWDEPRNGKNALFIGDKNGSNATELAQQSDFETYGWYGDGYILLSKNKSELYIAPADKFTDVPIKITNYHKPAINFEGYGYGYGGL